MKTQLTLKNTLEINLLSFTISISIIGMMYPYGFPIFSLLVFLMFVYSIIIVKPFYLPKTMWLYFILQFIYLMAILHSDNLYHADKLYNNNWNDIINIISFNIFIILIFSYVNDRIKMEIFVILFSKCIFVAALIVSLIGIIKFNLLLNRVFIEIFKAGEEYPWGSSLVSDNNMYSLGVILGILTGYNYLFKKTKSIIMKILILFSIFIMILNAFLSGSRRGIVILILLIIGYIIFSLSNIIFGIKSKIKLNKRNIFAILFVLFIIIIILSGIQLSQSLDLYQLEKLIYRYETISEIGEAQSSHFNIRFILWGHSLDIFNGYNIYNIIFGKGFDYLTIFYKEYSNNNVAEAEYYPHNFLISSLLYSGIIGFIIIILFILNILKNYYLTRKYSYVFSIMFIIALVIAFTSGNSFFSLKILIFLAMMSFLYVKIYNRE